MQTIQYQKGKFCTLPILSIKDEGKSSFFIVNANGFDYAIKMFEFQRTNEKVRSLSELPCMVKDIHGDEIVFVQNIAEMTKEIYPNGHIFTFIITKSTPSPFQNVLYYEVWDQDNGVPFRIKCKEKLKIHQPIECKISRPSQNKIILEPQKNNVSIAVQSCISLHELLSNCIINENLAHYIALTFYSLQNFDEARKYLEQGNPFWVIKALLSVPDAESWTNINKSDIPSILEVYKNICLYIIEDSDYLNQFEIKKRSFQNNIEDKIWMAEISSKCINLITQNKHKEEIDLIFKKIQTSGHLYNFKEKIWTLITILMMDPQILDEKIDDILNIIENQDKTKRDSYINQIFRSMLEVYINRNRSKTNRLAAVENDQSVQLLNKMIRSISYFILLSDKNNDEDNCQLFKAMLFHYLAFIRGKDALGNTKKTLELSESLIERAFTTLLEPEDDIQEIAWGKNFYKTEMLAYQLTSSKPKSITYSAKSFITENTRFSVSPNGITLSRTITTGKERNVLPPNVFDWHNIQIFLESANKYSIDKKSKFKTWQVFWDNVEAALFAPKEAINKSTIKKRLPDVGEDTTIRILYKDSNNEHPYRFYCKIEHPEHEGYGWIDSYQKGGSIGLFHYNPDLDSDSFNNDGKPMLLNVRVNSLSSPNDEYRTCTFDALSKIDNCVQENVSYNDTFNCRIIFETESKGTFLAITEFGFGIFLSEETKEEDVQLQVNFSVKVRIENVSNPAKIQGIVIGYADEEVDIKYAAESLLATYCNDNLYEETPEELEEEAMAVAEEQFDEESIREIVNIFAHKAVLEENNITAYSFLSLARILARMIENDDLKDYIDLNRKTVSVREFYKENGKVEESEIENICKKYEDIAEQSPYPMQRLAEIRIVNWFGKQEKNDMLWSIINNQECNPILKKLARLALSYNMSEGFGFQNQEQIINNKMKSLLNINVDLPKIYSFGEEDQLTEFKTSIVYPPENGMKPDRDRQTYNIMKVICGMANAYGGTLYLGVFNTGTAKGLEEDLPFFSNSKDKFDLYVRNQIFQAFGHELNSSIQIEYPEAGEHFVYAIKVPASQTPIRLLARDSNSNYGYFLREGTSTYAIDPNELAHIMANRNFNYYNVKASNINSINLEESAKEEATTTVTQKNTSQPIISEQILTSLTRRNVTDNWIEGFGEDTIGYLRILSESEWVLLDDVKWEEGLLTLAIHEDEEDGFIIVVYNNGKINKIPTTQLLKKEKGEPFKVFAEKPFFVSPLKKDDALLSVYEDEKGKRCMRIDSLNEIHDSSTSSAGATLSDLKFSNVCYCDIIKAENIGLFRKWVNLGRKTLGIQLLDISGEKAIEELNKIGINTEWTE